MTNLSVYEFGRALLDANDLDPVYVLLHEAGLESDLLRAWLIGYWCFYHVGTASWVAAGYDQHGEKGYWPRMRSAAGSKDYPRSAERRHFRGENARKSVAFLEGEGLEGLWKGISGRGEWGAASDLIEFVKTEWVGFGPWIAFKIADMVERLGIAPVRFDAATAMYDGSPTEAAKLLYAAERPGAPAPKSPAEVRAVSGWAAARVLSSQELTGRAAPPAHDRPLGFQEAETILCKWKSYLGGHYHVGEDVAACKKSLGRFPGCPVAARLYKAGEKGGLW